jgi:tRNA dimethylallyltransferase
MIYVICGPTGSGKTSVSELLANKLNAPIVNADAYQIYQEMNIGTDKISNTDPIYARYHLLDIVSPEESFSVMQYQKLFRQKIDELSKNHKDIIVCGGTGLYIRASLFDYEFKEQVADDVSDLESKTNEELYELLKTIDPKSLDTIHINNKKRLIRAISIARSGEQTKSEIIDSQEHKIIFDNVRILMLSPDRELLYNKINKRVDEMFEKGLLDEVKYLLNKYELSVTARAAIGYKEIIDALENNTSLEDAKELIKKKTRNYAKRQVTYFKHQLPCEIYSSKEELLEAIK